MNKITYKKILKKEKNRILSYAYYFLRNWEDAEDVTQEVFFKTYERLGTFVQKPKFSSWLYRIATNEALTFLKQKKKRAFAPWVDVEHKISETLESDPWFNGDEIQLKLQEAILKLPDKQRIVFNMKYFDEVKYEDMSVILETSVGALKASYHHAVKKIEAMLGDD